MYDHNLYNKFKNFWLMIASSVFSRVGFSSFNLIAIWVILYLTHSPLLSGLADGSMSAPLFLSFIMGAYVDSFKDKKLLAIISGILRILSLTLLLAGSLLDNIIIIILGVYFAGFMIGFTSDLINSVRAYWTKEFLDESQYKAGTSVSGMAFTIAEGVGFVASGAFLALGITDAFFIVLALFIASLIPLTFIKAYKDDDEQKISIFENIKSGFSFLAGNRSIIEMLIVTLIGNLILNIAGILFIFLIQIKYSLPAFFVSYVFGTLLFGMFLGSMLGRKISGKIGNIIGLTFITVGFSLLSIYFIKNIYMTFLPAATIGIAAGMSNVATGAAILKIVPQSFMARVQGTINTFGVAGITASGIIGGALVQLVGILSAFLMLGVVFIFISPLLIILKSMRQIYV